MKELTVLKVVCRHHGFGHYDYYIDIEEDLHDLLKPGNIAKGFRMSSTEGILFTNIYKSGLVKIGYRIFEDPAHGNEEYTWSSRASVMNGAFKLKDTEYELCKSGIGIRGKEGGCYWAAECTVKALQYMLEQAIEKDIISVAESTCGPLNWNCDIHSISDLMKYELNNNVEYI